MAGFIIPRNDNPWAFNICGKGLAEQLHEINDRRRVMTLQLDGDELEAALWGLENFQKHRMHDIVVSDNNAVCTCGWSEKSNRGMHRPIELARAHGDKNRPSIIRDMRTL